MRPRARVSLVSLWWCCRKAIIVAVIRDLVGFWVPGKRSRLSILEHATHTAHSRDLHTLVGNDV